jgi:hypothetical protein
VEVRDSNGNNGKGGKKAGVNVITRRLKEHLLYIKNKKAMKQVYK